MKARQLHVGPYSALKYLSIIEICMYSPSYSTEDRASFEKLRPAIKSMPLLSRRSLSKINVGELRRPLAFSKRRGLQTVSPHRESSKIQLGTMYLDFNTPDIRRCFRRHGIHDNKVVRYIAMASPIPAIASCNCLLFINMSDSELCMVCRGPLLAPLER